jgi:hypothetical protein
MGAHRVPGFVAQESTSVFGLAWARARAQKTLSNRGSVDQPHLVCLGQGGGGGLGGCLTAVIQGPGDS